MTRVLGRHEMEQVASDLRLSAEQVERTLSLLDAGNTIPFITRYRRDRTGGLDENAVRAVQQRAVQLRSLADRKESILKSVASQHKLTPQLKSAIRRAKTSKRLEDLYRPFKPKKQSLARSARDQGLEPFVTQVWGPGDSDHPPEREENATHRTGLPDATGLPGGEATPGPQQRPPQTCHTDDSLLAQQAREWLAHSDQLTSESEVLEGAAYLLAERFHEDAELRDQLRRVVQDTGKLICTRISPMETGAEPNKQSRSEQSRSERAGDTDRSQRSPSAFRHYFDYSEPLQKIKPHRILAINRGERERVLRVRLEPDVERIWQVARESIPEDAPFPGFLEKALRDAIQRLIVPSLEREFRRELTEDAEAHAIDVFSRNLRKLLLQPPLRNQQVLAISPAFKSGCKLAVLDAYGNVQTTDRIHLIGGEERVQAGRRRLVELILNHAVSAIAIGNGAACRETEILVAEILASELADLEAVYTIVNEAGASDYSTSELGREELPQYDPIDRSAISIGRRLLDPLSELVKIPPAHLGVGMYQHDVKQKQLQDALDAVVESSVNYVGVDVNTASPSVLRYVSGLNQLTARRLYEYRLAHGPFRNRQQFQAVPGFGEATFVQAAGFLKVRDGDEPLDATRIHPESYGTVERLLEALGGPPQLELSPAPSPTASPTSSGKPNQRTLALARFVREQTENSDLEALAERLGISRILAEDLIQCLTDPGRDPRDDLPPPVFRRGILKLEDLSEGMELTGTVLNVVDFGAFVDIGLSDSGLVHISRLADRFVRDPHEIVSVGDVLTVWVQAIDKSRRRVSLSAIDPTAARGQRPKPARHSKPTAVQRSPEASASTPDAHAKSKRSQSSSGRAKSGNHRRSASERSGRSGAGRTKKPATPPPPLTPAMEEGREPLRSFSDLMQFYSKTEEESRPANRANPPPQNADPESNSAASSQTNEPSQSDTPSTEEPTADPALPHNLSSEAQPPETQPSETQPPETPGESPT